MQPVRKTGEGAMQEGEVGRAWSVVGDAELPKRASCDISRAVEGLRCDAKPVGCLRAASALHMLALSG